MSKPCSYEAMRATAIVGNPTTYKGFAQTNYKAICDLVIGRDHNVGQLVLENRDNDDVFKCVNNHVYRKGSNTHQTTALENSDTRREVYAALSVGHEYWRENAEVLRRILIGENAHRPLNRDMVKALIDRKVDTRFDLTRGDMRSADEIVQTYTSLATDMTQRFINSGRNTLGVSSREEAAYAIYNLDEVFNGVGGICDLFKEAVADDYTHVQELAELMAAVLEKKGVITSSERQNLERIKGWRGNPAEPFRRIFEAMNNDDSVSEKFNWFATRLARLLKNYAVAEAAGAGKVNPDREWWAMLLTIKGNRDPDRLQETETVFPKKMVAAYVNPNDKPKGNKDEAELRRILDSLPFERPSDDNQPSTQQKPRVDTKQKKGGGQVSGNNKNDGLTTDEFGNKLFNDICIVPMTENNNTYDKTKDEPHDQGMNMNYGSDTITNIKLNTITNMNFGGGNTDIKPDNDPNTISTTTISTTTNTWEAPKEPVKPVTDPSMSIFLDSEKGNRQLSNDARVLDECYEEVIKLFGGKPLKGKTMDNKLKSIIEKGGENEIKKVFSNVYTKLKLNDGKILYRIDTDLTNNTSGERDFIFPRLCVIADFSWSATSGYDFLKPERAFASELTNFSSGVDYRGKIKSWLPGSRDNIFQAFKYNYANKDAQIEWLYDFLEKGDELLKEESLMRKWLETIPACIKHIVDKSGNSDKVKEELQKAASGYVKKGIEKISDWSPNANQFVTNIKKVAKENNIDISQFFKGGK